MSNSANLEQALVPVFEAVKTLKTIRGDEDDMERSDRLYSLSCYVENTEKTTIEFDPTEFKSVAEAIRWAREAVTPRMESYLSARKDYVSAVAADLNMVKEYNAQLARCNAALTPALKAHIARWRADVKKEETELAEREQALRRTIEQRAEKVLAQEFALDNREESGKRHAIIDEVRMIAQKRAATTADEETRSMRVRVREAKILDKRIEDDIEAFVDSEMRPWSPSR